MLSDHGDSSPLRYPWWKPSIILSSKKIVWHSPPSAVSQLAETQLKQIGWQQFVRYFDFDQCNQRSSAAGFRAFRVNAPVTSIQGRDSFDVQALAYSEQTRRSRNRPCACQNRPWRHGHGFHAVFCLGISYLPE